MALARCNLVVTDEAGNVIDGASVEVRRENTGALTPCYSDRDGTAPLGNPFVAADGANAGFYIVGGAYRVTATKDSFERVWRHVGVGLSQESDLSVGPPGVRFAFSDATVAADPGTGQWRANHATFASITALYIDNSDAAGATVTSWLDALDDLGTAARRIILRIERSVDPLQWAEFYVTGSVVDSTGYRTVQVQPVAQVGWPFTSGHQFAFTRLGSPGADGSDPGILMTWDTGTADADPGAGDIRANNASLASATFLYVSKTSRGGSSLATFLLDLAASTSLVKGHITLTRVADETQAIVSVTGVTDATGYVKVAITGHSGATSFTAADPISVQFSRAGDAGSGGGAWANTRLAKTAAYTVVNADKGRTIALSGFFTLTIGAASGYDSDFAIMVVNEGATRAPIVAPSGKASFFLYPGQTALVFAQNNVWQIHRDTRWKIPTGVTNMYCDFTNGLDTNDGLAAGAGNAKKTLQNCLDTIANEFDHYSFASGVGRIVVNMAAGVTDTQGVHFSGHAFVGANGGAAVKVQGGAGAIISTTSADAFGIFCNCIIQIAGVKVQTTTFGYGIACSLGAQVYVLDGMEFGACATGHMNANDGGKIYRSNNYTVSGNFGTVHMIAQGPGSAIKGSGLTVTVSANVTGTYWVLASNHGTIVATTETYSLGANTVTAKRYDATNLGLISTNSGNANYFPGNVAGTPTISTLGTSGGLCT